ncbi:MAG TPA: hypothetical protein VEA79_11620 [Phenylobacterium sp.]|nr:hypothetical protein [Phenylobacterium sp.]
MEVEPLSALDMFFPAAAETGLPDTLWRDASPSLAREVFDRISRQPLSPAARALSVRVLATGANAPSGAGSDADLAAARANALIALGQAEGAARILDRAPGQTRNEPLSRAAAEAFLRTARPERACETARDLTVDRERVYWLRLRAFCQALDGQADAAAVTFSLANQTERDAVFSRLMSALLAGGGNPGTASFRNGLEIALSRRLGLGDPPAASPPPIVSDALSAEVAGLLTDPGAIDRQFEALAAATAPAARTRIARRILILAAVGAAVTDEQRARIAALDGGRSGAPTGWLLALSDAAAAGQMGQTALAALWIAQAAGPAGPATADRVLVIAALRRVGLSEDARNFALEGLAALADPR